MRIFLLLSFCIFASFCKPDSRPKVLNPTHSLYKNVVPAAETMIKYIPLLERKNVAMVVNQTSIVGNKHLVDTLRSFDIKIKKIFSPEHGFRGNADAGTKVNDGKDASTGIPIKSLYGKNKKPTREDLENIDVVLFDIQDVGVRFYTYISTMTYVMEACAEMGIPMIVLDRPNPNGFYVDGPMLDSKFSSFIGLHPVPVVYGMTIGEYALMVNGESWLKNDLTCDLTVIPCLDYTHKWSEELPIKPSPNLPNHEAVLLYPSLCFFEGSTASEGRGTEAPFQLFGHPEYPHHDFSFKPTSGPGSKYPKFENTTCYGKDLRNLDATYLKAEKSILLNYFVDFYREMGQGENFFLKNNFIDKLAGTDQFKRQVLSGLTAEEIKSSWEFGLSEFMETRSKYLLYP